MSSYSRFYSMVNRLLKMYHFKTRFSRLHDYFNPCIKDNTQTSKTKISNATEKKLLN